MARASIIDDHRVTPRPPTAYKMNGDEEEDESNNKQCRHCKAPSSLFLDWAQGDRVCMNCGVVDEDHVRDDRPEWREFDDADDLAKGGASRARCGMVPVDETRHLGGLEPTTLSRNIFGLSGGCGGGATHPQASNIRKKLIRANRRIDLMMVRQNAKALKQAKLSRRVRQKKLCKNGNSKRDNTDTDITTDFYTEDDDDAQDNVRPEHEQLLIQEEEDAHRSYEALNADKWSLERAILLNGTDDEQPQINNSNNSSQHHIDSSREAQREDLLQRLDGQMTRAAFDLYTAYTMLQSAAQRLHLPMNVTNEATNLLRRYAARKDGFYVKGVSSRLSPSSAAKGGGGDGSVEMTTTTEIKNEKKTKTKLSIEEKETMERLREFNKVKQMASLGSGLLYLTSRKLGWTRALPDVCSSFQQQQQQDGSSSSGAQQFAVAASTTTATGSSSLVKPKHCSKAINEIKAIFPDYVRSSLRMAAIKTKNGASGANGSSHHHHSDANDTISTGNFVDHATRKLNLPPVALASVRFLVSYCRKEQKDLGIESGTKLSTFCASLTYFICTAGATMQKLAAQQQEEESSPTTTSSSSKRLNTEPVATTHSSNNKKKRKTPSSDSSTTEQGTTPNKKSRQRSPISTTASLSSKEAGNNTGNNSNDEGSNNTGFDVFSHEAMGHDPEARTYEMRRFFDAWSEQMSWSRNISLIEQSCGVSRNVLLDYYKKKIYPRRNVLLDALMKATSTTCNSSSSSSSTTTTSKVDNNSSSSKMEDMDLSVQDTPLSSVLLSNITAAASIMNNR